MDLHRDGEWGFTCCKEVPCSVRLWDSASSAYSVGSPIMVEAEWDWTDLLQYFIAIPGTSQIVVMFTVIISTERTSNMSLLFAIVKPWLRMGFNSPDSFAWVHWVLNERCGVHLHHYERMCSVAMEEDTWSHWIAASVGV